MLAAAIEYQQSAKTPYAESTEVFDGLKEYLGSREAHKMTEADLERELNRRGKELMRQLLQGHLKSRGPGEAVGPVEDSDGVERSNQRWNERAVETTFGTVDVERIGYASDGCESLHPLDGSLNLPPERYSLEVRHQIAESAASRSFDETLLDLARHTGAEVPKRQAEELVLRAAQDFDAFYEARREQEGQVQPDGTVLVLTFDGKGVVMHRQDLREMTRKAALARQQHKERLSKLFKRLSKGEKANSKRMATVAAVYTVDPFVRTPEEFLASLMPPKPKPAGPKTKIVRPRPQAKRVWASVEKEPWQVILEGLEEAQRRDPERLKTWVVVVDGAEHQLDLIKEMAEAFEAKVTIIVDIIHVTEYIWKAAHVFHREGSPELEYWAWTRVRGVLEGKASTIAGAMRRAATGANLSADKRKPVDKCADYLLKYSPYLKYDSYLTAGYPIASGVIEGACRYLVRDRMELTGARWRLAGAEAVLRLRALRASGDFDAYWDFHEAREHQRNHARHYAGGTVPALAAPPAPQTHPRLRRVK